MKTWRAIVAGLAGGVLAVAIVQGAAWVSGGEGDLCGLLGAVVTGDAGTAAWIAGCVAQLAMAAAGGIVYAAIFEWVVTRAGALTGAAIAVPHAIVAGLAMGFLPASRLLDAGVMPPGAFMEYRGATVLAAFVAAHLVFGAVVGGTYGGTRHAVRSTTLVWHDVTDPERRPRAQE
jgi:hypothetical protein